MPYASPSATEIRLWTRVNSLMLDLSDEAFDAYLAAQVVGVEAEIQAILGADAFTGLTAERNITLAKRGVAFYVAADAYLGASGNKATGTEAPLGYSEAKDLQATADEFRERADRYVSRAMGVQITTAEESSPAFAMPAVRSSGITYASSDPSPSERTARLDERDDLSSEEEE